MRLWGRLHPLGCDIRDNYLLQCILGFKELRFQKTVLKFLTTVGLSLTVV